MECGGSTRFRCCGLVILAQVHVYCSNLFGFLERCPLTTEILIIYFIILQYYSLPNVSPANMSLSSLLSVCDCINWPCAKLESFDLLGVHQYTKYRIYYTYILNTN